MIRPAAQKIRAFGSAAAAIVVAAVLTRSCPGGCGTCTSCAAAVVPMGLSLSVVGAALAGNARRNRGPH